jgi:hypothetical protein
MKNEKQEVVMEIKIQVEGNFIKAFSPYHPTLIDRAKALNGKWDSEEKCWKFDYRDESRVRALYKKIYGTDGIDKDLVTLRIRTRSKIVSEDQQAIFLGGREIARATSKHSGAKLGEGIIVLDGVFKSGGSAQYWKTESSDIVEFEIRDLPKIAALELIGEKKDKGDRSIFETIEIIEYEPANGIDEFKIEFNRDELDIISHALFLLSRNESVNISEETRRGADRILINLKKSYS